MKLFGTDGIRDLAGRGPLADEAIVRLGWALAEILGAGKKVFLARDPRPSGPRILRILAASLVAKGVQVDVASPEVLPTPGVAFALRDSGEYALGIVISASHNPPEYNGIKLFDHDGLKLTEGRERQIEAAVERQPTASLPSIVEPAPAETRRHREAYVRHLQGQLESGDLKGWKVGVDSAHGATAGMFQACLRHWGALPVVMADTEDGGRINSRCGATDPKALQLLVKTEKARLGVAFDGDGDRCVFVDECGSLLDGDAVLYFLSKDLQSRGQWKPAVVVATEISNLGLDRAVSRLGGRVLRVPVGDRQVVMEMRETGALLGGEPSGHFILPDSNFIGDGQLAAARVLGVMARTGKSLSELVKGYVPFPSLLKNVKVSRKPPVEELPALVQAIRDGVKALGAEGRLVVRYSGTEPLLRILAEGPERGKLEAAVGRVEKAAEVLR